MYFKAEENEYGEYLRADGKRCVLQQCRRVRPQDGWTVFDNIEECLTTWGLKYTPADDTPDAP